MELAGDDRRVSQIAQVIAVTIKTLNYADCARPLGSAERKMLFIATQKDIIRCNLTLHSTLAIVHKCMLKEYNKVIWRTRLKLLNNTAQIIHT